MNKQSLKEVSDIQGIVNVLFDSSKEAELSSLAAIKQLFPLTDTSQATICIKPENENKCIDIILQHLGVLENTIQSSEEELRLQKRIIINPDSVGGEEFCNLLELIAQTFSYFEDTRLMLFYTLTEKQLVADVIIKEQKLFIKITPYESKDNSEFYSRCLKDAPEDSAVRSLWYEETFEASIFSSDIPQRYKNIKMLEQILPDDQKAKADTKFSYAMCEFKLEHPLKAMEYLHEAIEILPDHFASLEQLATQYFHEKAYAQAVVYYERAIQLIPDGGRDMLARKIDCLIALDRWKELPTAISDLVTFTPIWRSRWLLLFCKKFGDYKRHDLRLFALHEIADNYQKKLSDNSIKTNEKSELLEVLHFTYLHLVYTQHALGNMNSALMYIDKIINEYQWDNKAAHRAKAIILMELKMIPELEEEIEILKVLESKDPETYVLEGGLLILKHKFEEALSAYQKAVRLEPYNCYNGYFGVGHALAWLGRDTEAISYYQKSLTIKPNQPRCLSDLGSSLANIGQTNEAIEALNKAITLEPTYYHPYYVLGCIAAKAGNAEEAIQWLSASIACNPDVVARLKEEPDLISLRSLSIFQKLLQ
ncbi:MAG: tetratricopeptide repeat protein [Cytophagia bacterium]|nr:tetratricopeptide repeat protein [Cytophagia bacterium]